MNISLKTYDQFSRQKIILAVNNVLRRKRLTKTQLASQVQADTEQTFDRKYFSRLEAGTLSNELVDAVVSTIENRYYHNFRLHLEQGSRRKPELSTNQDEYTTTFSGINWKPLPHHLKDRVLEKFKLPKDVIIPPSQFSVRYNDLGFCKGWRILNLTAHHAVPSVSFHFLTDGKRSISLNRSREVNALASDLSFCVSLDTAIEYVQFVMLFLQDGEAEIIFSVKQFVHLSESEISYVASVCNEDGGSMLPRVRRTENGFQIRLVTQQMERISLLDVELTPTGHILDLNSAEVHDADPTTNSSSAEIDWLADTLSLDIETHPHSASIENQINIVVGLSEVGETLLRGARRGLMNYTIYGSHKFSCSFEMSSRAILLGAPYNEAKLTERNLLEVVQQLRFVDQELIGKTLPDPRENLTEYAIVAHSKNMDSIVWVCNFIIGLPDAHREEFIQAMPRVWIGMYDAVCAGASKAIIFEIYSGL